MRPFRREDRLRELLVERVLYGLDAAQQQQLDQILPQRLEREVEAYELAAAAAHLALLTNARSPMPTSLRERIAREVGAHMAGERPDSRRD